MWGVSLTAGQGLSGPMYRVDEVPEHFQEHFILRGYRHPKSSVTQCLWSLFDATNETLNIWTHFLPAWYFVYVLCYYWRTVDFLNDSYTWPLLCYLLVCCAFPLASAVAHLFNVMSDWARHFCFFLDYSVLSLFSFGVAIVYRAYCFPTDLLAEEGRYRWYLDNYVNIAAVLAILCTFTSCETRFMRPSPLRKVLRLGAFATPYIYDSVPLLYRLFHNYVGDAHLSAQSLHTRQFIFAFLAAFLYASHLPERLRPGIFDIVGHSHQLFHVCSILAVMDQLQAVVWDYKERRDLMSGYWNFKQYSHSLAYLTAIFCINASIILLFTFRLVRLKHKLKLS